METNKGVYSEEQLDQVSSCKPKQGFKDAGHHILNCANCLKSLMDIWVVRVDETFADGSPFEFNYRATCPYCGGSSYKKKIRGKIYPGGIAIPNPDRPDDDLRLLTQIDRTVSENDGWVFHVTEGKAD